MRVRLCFFVKVRKATGRRVGGGSKMGNTVGGGRTAVGMWGFNGCSGVPNAGEDDGISDDAVAGGGDDRDAVRFAGLKALIITSTTTGQRSGEYAVSSASS